MRHLNAGRKFGRNTSHRRAMFRNLAANLITHERVQTTDTKAKEVRRIAERLITKAIRLGEVAYTPAKDLKPADAARRLHTQRLISGYIPRFGVALADGAPKKIDLVEKVLLDLAKRFQGRPGGYTRIIKLGPRRGDNADMALLELLAATDDKTDKAKGAAKAAKGGKGGTGRKVKAPTAAEPKTATKAE